MGPKAGNRKISLRLSPRRVLFATALMLLLAFTFYMWRIQEQMNLSRIEGHVESKSRFYLSETEIRYGRIHQALAQLASRGAPNNMTRGVKWESDAYFYEDAFAGIEAIVWVDQSFLVRAVAPHIGSGISLDEPASTLEEGASRILLWVPIQEDGTFSGFIVGLIDLTSFMQPVAVEIEDGYVFQLSQDETSLMQSDEWSEVASGRIVSSTITLEPAVLNMRFGPTLSLVQSGIVAARWILYAGLFVILAGATAAYAAQVSRRTKLHKELQEQWANWEAILDGIPSMIYVSDPDTYEVLFANQHLQNLLGMDPLGKQCYEVLQSFDEPCPFCTNDILRKTDEPYSWQYFNPLLKKHFMVTDRLIPWPNPPVAKLELAIDITEKMALEEHLQHSQKLEAIGTLASGVAHEINNPLMGMMNYAELANDLVQDPKATEYLKEVGVEGNRIAKIVRTLLSFSRQDKEGHSPADIRDIIDRSLSLIGSVLRKDQITIELNIPDDLPTVKCRSQQIEQVLINLLTNARDALNVRYPDYDENKLIRIRARMFEKDGDEWIRTTVEDHGAGIPEKVVKRIFDPFFTTKSRSEGTGLGLSVSFDIVREHHGALTVESVPNEYTRFHIDLRVNNGWILDTSVKGVAPVS